MTEQEAREDEREAVIQAFNTTGVYPDQAERIADRVLTAIAPYRKHPEHEITDEMVLRFLNARNPRAATQDLDDWGYETVKATRTALEAALRVPVGEGEHGCPYCDEVRRMDATYGSQIGVCIKHRPQPVPPAAPDWMPRIGGEPA